VNFFCIKKPPGVNRTAKISFSGSVYDGSVSGIGCGFFGYGFLLGLLGLDSVLFVGFLDYSLVFNGLESWFFSGRICWFFRIWISFVADTKMEKTWARKKLFRLTFIFARRKADMPDELFFDRY
jgi:hypothetical protein